jgi:ABC-2 type transport system ATP-binding protein
MIEIQNLTKKFRNLTAVDDLSFTAESGRVTGFLGPNGAGKTTTMRMMVGLDRPTSGWARIDGRELKDFECPLRAVGVLLNVDAAPAQMTARNHLRWLARAGMIPLERADTVLEIVGLGDAMDRRIGSMSLGMRQRVGVAAALLGDPGTLILDEPINGLDPDGVLWIRTLLKKLAAEGRTVLVSSHLMFEMQETADRVVVVGRGRLVAEMSMAELDQQVSTAPVRVRTAHTDEVVAELQRRQDAVTVERLDGDAVRIVGATGEQIGTAAFDVGSPVYELTAEAESLEDVYMKLTHDATEYRATTEDPVGALR